MPQTRIGEYQLRSGNAAAAFWRIVPGLDAAALSIRPCAPGPTAN